MEYGKKIQNKKNEKYTLKDLEYGEETENVETETQTLQDLEFDRNFEKRGKSEMHTVGPGVWR